MSRPYEFEPSPELHKKYREAMAVTWSASMTGLSSITKGSKRELKHIIREMRRRAREKASFEWPG